MGRSRLDGTQEHHYCVDTFKDCHDLVILSIKMVQTQRDEFFSLVYRLIKPALLLLVATAYVERAFSDKFA